MKLVVDANILVSFFRENPVRLIIINSKFLNLQLFSPEYALTELKNNIEDIIKYSKLSYKQVETIIEETLKTFITIIQIKKFEQYKEKAQELSPHKSDKDNPYFALALKLNCGIWSNEPAFKKQSKVKTFNTAELRELLDIGKV